MSVQGINGIVEASNGNWNNVIMDLRLQADGKILAAGNSYYTMILLAGYNSNGSIDTTFGVNGFIQNNIGTSTNIF